MLEKFVLDSTIESSWSLEILLGRRRLIKAIQLLERFFEGVKDFSRSMEKVWPSMTLSEYAIVALFLASLGLQVVLSSAYISHVKIELPLDIACDEICKLIKTG